MSGEYRALAQFITIAEIDNAATARVLIVALKAHGFHPLEGGEDGLPGMPGIRSIKGQIAIKVPEHESEDAEILVGALIADMKE